MGYTHYWSHDENLDPSALIRALNDCREVAAAVQNRGIILRGPDGTGEPEVSELGIDLNGDGEESHETFSFPIRGEDAQTAKRLYGCRWAFCKTARKPYDLAVCAMLLVFKHHLGDQVRLASDGRRRPDEWLPAERLVKDVLGYEVRFRAENTMPARRKGAA